jgi:uncharacterized protein (UPF0216 family)
MKYVAANNHLPAKDTQDDELLGSELLHIQTRTDQTHKVHTWKIATIAPINSRIATLAN